METLADQRRKISKADEHIAEGEARVGQQRLLVERLRAVNHPDAAAAQVLLETMTGLIVKWRHHRARVAADIERMRTP